MKNSIKIRCSADRTAVIDIEGTIGVESASSASHSVATYEAFNRALDEIRALDVEQITVTRSPGCKVKAGRGNLSGTSGSSDRRKILS